jgi:hypothetical protein
LESSLYLPVKRFLEKLGFEVKGEVCACDLVALDAGSPTAVVIGEPSTGRPPATRSGWPCALRAAVAAVNPIPG